MRAITAFSTLSTLAMCAWWAAAQAPPTPLTFTDGTQIKADLNSEIDSGAAQVGDQITVTVTDSLKQGKSSLPKGAVLVGKVARVTAAQSTAGGEVAVRFERADFPNGKSFSLLAGIASVKLQGTGSTAPSRGGRGRRGGGYPGGGYPGGGYPSGGEQPSSTPPPAPSAPVFRFPSDAAAVGSVISTTSGDVILGPGSKLTLQVIAAPSAPNGI